MKWPAVEPNTLATGVAKPAQMPQRVAWLLDRGQDGGGRWTPNACLLLLC